MEKINQFNSIQFFFHLATVPYTMCQFIGFSLFHERPLPSLVGISFRLSVCQSTSISSMNCSKKTLTARLERSKNEPAERKSFICLCFLPGVFRVGGKGALLVFTITGSLDSVCVGTGIDYITYYSASEISLPSFSN